MPVDKVNKLAFCHVPRTGGVSICNALKLTVMDLHFPASWYRENFPDYFLFATFRDYRDRIESTFGWKNPEAVEDRFKKGERNVGLMLKPNEYFLDVEVDCLLRFSHLNEDLNNMLRQRGIKEVKLVQCNSFR